MKLILRPAGRGNWAVITMIVEGDRASPLLIKIGDTIEIGGITFRVTEVTA